jgi:hypothetical protein
VGKRKGAKWLDRTLVVCPYYFTLCTSEKLFHKAAKRFHVKCLPPWLSDGANATAHSFSNGEGELAAIVCIKVTDQTIAQVAVLLAHEAMHIWRWTREHYGEDTPSFEFEAYAVQSLTQRLMGEYIRQTKGKKRGN